MAQYPLVVVGTGHLNKGKNMRTGLQVTAKKTKKYQVSRIHKYIRYLKILKYLICSFENTAGKNCSCVIMKICVTDILVYWTFCDNDSISIFVQSLK